MDQIADSTTAGERPRSRLRLPGSTWFMGCFGGGGGASHAKPPQQNPKSIAKSRCFSLPRCLTSKKSPRRTFPVDAAVDEKSHQMKGFVWFRKLSKKHSFSGELPVKNDGESRIPVPAPEGISHGEQKKLYTRCSRDPGINIEKGKLKNHVGSVKKATCQQGRISKCTFTRSISSNHCNLPASNCLTRSASVSVVPIARNDIVGTCVEKIRDSSVERPRQKVNMGFDRLLGMLIITIALVIMIVWGKLCAILCTSAWLYMNPLFRVKIEESLVVNGEDKEEYKKRVVMEGLLERNHHTII